MRGTNCAAKVNRSAVCVSTVTRTVWDGAQVLFEVRAAGDSLAPGEILPLGTAHPVEHYWAALELELGRTSLLFNDRCLSIHSSEMCSA
jgi:hypothetical protein